MGNLGPYEQITTLAKQLGGVENLVKSIEASGAAKAAPKVVIVTGVTAVALTAGVMTGGRALLARYRATRAAGAAAAGELKAAVAETSSAGPPDAGETEPPAPS